MSLGVVRYCTPEGGSGFIPNSSLPWMSSFDWSQQAPVYDQTTAWLRDSPPGSYTNYARFGPPYSMDGGVLPPYWLGDDGEPVPVSAGGGCGMGAVDPGVFEARYGRPEPSESICLQIQCGAISQDQAGQQLIVDCMNAGYAGARSCNDPACGPWISRIPGCVPTPSATPQVLLRSDVVAPMPSIVSAAWRGCASVPNPCPSGVASWIESNPWLALGLAVVAGAVIFGGRK